MGLKNTCNCPQPPGGRAICEPHQLAICRVRNGQAHAQCMNPPSTPSGPLAVETVTDLSNWALSLVTGDDRPPSQAVSEHELRMLLAGTFDDDERGERITFSIPESLAEAIAAQLRESSATAYIEEQYYENES